MANVTNQLPVINSLPQLKQTLLSNRGITNEAEFFQPTHPTDLSLESVGLAHNQFDEIVRRLFQARDQQQKVVVFGDYDVDGVCATTIMWEALVAHGLAAWPFLPHREKHGYGLSSRAIPDLLADGKPDLIITVDNGIVAHGAIAELQAAGVDVIVTDHHQPDPTLGSPAPLLFHTTQLCGTTVAWMFARELYRKSGLAWKDQSLELCALATLADQVPLLAANRSFAFHGLKVFPKTPRVGLQALMKVAALDPTQMNSMSVSFGLAPRINAMGRLGHSLEALRLLCTKQPDRAQKLAQVLQQTNLQRQELTQSMLEIARAQATSQADHHLIVVADRDFHEGIIGLLAGKLTEELTKPVIAVAIGEITAKASARSVAGVNIVELIREVRAELLELGGHPLAAGFSVLSNNLEVATKKLQSLAQQTIKVEQLTPMIEVEAELNPALLTLETSKLLAEFEPFGQANPEPVFKISELVLTDKTTMGQNAAHLKLLLAGPNHDGKPVVAIAWRQGPMANQLVINQPIEVSGALQVNSWKDKQSLQVMLKSWKQR